MDCDLGLAKVRRIASKSPHFELWCWRDKDKQEINKASQKYNNPHYPARKNVNPKWWIQFKDKFAYIIIST
jgi:hypothetical protein